jgi:hypothetical protein
MPNMREKPLAGAHAPQSVIAMKLHYLAFPLRNMPQSPCFCVNGQKSSPDQTGVRLKLPPGFGNTRAWIYSGILNPSFSIGTMISVNIIWGMKITKKI